MLILPPTTSVVGSYITSYYIYTERILSTNVCTPLGNNCIYKYPVLLYIHG